MPKGTLGAVAAAQASLMRSMLRICPTAPRGGRLGRLPRRR